MISIKYVIGIERRITSLSVFYNKIGKVSTLLVKGSTYCLIFKTVITE